MLTLLSLHDQHGQKRPSCTENKNHNDGIRKQGQKGTGLSRKVRPTLVLKTTIKPRQTDNMKEHTGLVLAEGENGPGLRCAWRTKMRVLFVVEWKRE